MKKFKKLIPSFLMLLISASLMGTSTFAWFSMNTTVSATGMEIKAEVPTQLLIKGSAQNAEYKSDIDFSDIADSAVYTENKLTHLFPVAYKTRSASVSNPNDTFYKLTSSAYSKVDVNGLVEGTDADFSTADFTLATAGIDYVKDTFTLKYAGEYSAELAGCKVMITMTEVADKVSNIRNATHIILVDDKTTPNVYEFDMSNATGTAVAGEDTDYVLENQAITSFSEANEEITYTIYLFFDGEDSDCKNSNAVNMDFYSFKLTIELYDNSTP